MQPVDQNAIVEGLQAIFDNVFAGKVTVRRNLTAAEVQGWDSLRHVKLVLAVEKEFKIRFTMPEIVALENVGQLLELIQKKVAV